MQSVRTAESGANRPLVIRGLNTHTQTTGDYVLKYRGAERMDEAACGRELLASFLAGKLNIHVPHPCLIQVGDLFLGTLTNHKDYGNIKKSKGLNFGSSYISGNSNLMSGQKLSLFQQEQAARIFLFDLVMENGDRRFEKPNMFLSQKNIYVIDHELPYGFSAILPFLRTNDNPWDIGAAEIQAAQKHFFYRTLKRNDRINWTAAGRPFLHIDADFWTRARDLIPLAWMNRHDFDTVRKHFTAIQSNFEEFKAQAWNKILQ